MKQAIRGDRDARHVDDIDVVTSAGVPAGLDPALYLVTRLSFPGRAESVRRDLRYAP